MILKILSVLFPTKETPVKTSAELTPAKPDVSVGEFWVLDRSDGSPWPAVGPESKVQIIDVKDGWVRYFINQTYPDNRRPVKDFTSIYKKQN